jgi:hypothetical protein
MMASIRSRVIGISLLVVAAVGYTWATWRFFTQPVPGGNDFFANVSPWEAFLKYDINPYSDEAARYTQQAIYGRPALPDEDQNRLVYPFYSILLHGPFVFIDYSLARAIYMTMLQAAIIVGLVLTLDLIAWQPPVWLLGVTLAWSLLYYPEARSVILGQFAPFGFLSLAGTLYLLRRKKDILAGSLLVLATFKPTLVFLVAPFLLLWGVTRSRWRFVAGFTATLTVLSLGSMFVLPTWIQDWAKQITRYPAYTVGQSPVWLLCHQYFPWMGNVGEWVLNVLLVIGLLVSWWKALRQDGANIIYWALGVTLVVSNLIVPRSATTNYVLMLIPVLWIIAALDRLGWRGRMASLVVMIAMLAGHWWLHLATVIGNQEQPVVFLPMPLALGAALVIGRAFLLRDAKLHRISL